MLEKIDTTFLTIFFMMSLFTLICSSLILFYSNVSTVRAAQSRSSCRNNTDVVNNCPNMMNSDHILPLEEAGFNMLMASLVFTCLCIAVYVSKWNSGELDF